MQFDWKSYFIFTSKEQKGIVVLGCILIFSLLLHYIIPGNQIDKNFKGTFTNTPVKLFYFDPNSLDTMNGYQLGLSKKQMATLYRYRAKGGRFDQKEDLLKWYGLSESKARALMPWVRINKTATVTQIRNKLALNSTWNHQQAKIDINNTNANDWMRITGLPSYKVKRILTYQKWSGGFTSIHALKKVYGFTAFDFEMIRPFIVYQAKKHSKLSYQSMRFEDWMALGIFDEKTVWAILRLRNEQDGKLSWSKLVIQFDLTEEEALVLKKRTNLSN